MLSFNPELPPAYKNSEYVFLANLDPDVQLKVLNQLNNTKLIASDTMNLWIKKKKKSLLKLVVLNLQLPLIVELLQFTLPYMQLGLKKMMKL